MFRYLRSKVVLAVSLLIIAGGVVTIVSIVRDLSQALAASADRSGLAFARTLAAQLSEPLVYRDRMAVRRHLLFAQTANPDVVYVFVASAEGVVTDHSFATGGFPADLVPVARRTAPTTVRSEDGVIRDLSAPIAEGVLGTVHVGLSTSWVDAAVSSSTTNVFLATALVMIVGIAGILVMARLILASQLGQYTLEEVIGEGGMGTVYRARHAMLRRPTALKLLPQKKAGKSAVERFEREVRLTAQLTHPNTVTVYDYGRTPDGVFYYAMELLEGATLQAVVEATGPMPAARVAHILDQVAGALDEAHGVGLIHRDIKPANVMLCERGGLADVAKVLDFGLVKKVTTAGDVALTGANEVTGTPLYMSPEAIRSTADIGAAADIYSLGAVAYYLLTGKHVFVGKTSLEVCSQHLSSTPEPMSSRVDAEIPPQLERLVLDCLAKDPSDRPGSALEVQQRLRACADLGVWDRDRARQWWRRHEGLKLRHPTRGGERLGTITVDTSVRDRAARSGSRSGSGRSPGTSRRRGRDAGCGSSSGAGRGAG